MTQRYEYKVVRVFGKRPETLEADLNKLGADGWLVVYAGEFHIILGRGFEPAPSQEVSQVPQLSRKRGKNESP